MTATLALRRHVGACHPEVPSPRITGRRSQPPRVPHPFVDPCCPTSHSRWYREFDRRAAELSDLNGAGEASPPTQGAIGAARELLARILSLDDAVVGQLGRVGLGLASGGGVQLWLTTEAGRTAELWTDAAGASLGYVCDAPGQEDGPDKDQTDLATADLGRIVDWLRGK